ncbi:type I restriction-modification system, R subunit [Streptococcus pneumoniae]|nr:type I restriction-modification system, R subunit [Streptococcus pneumoniae]
MSLIVLDSNIQSMTEFKQIIGRGTRLYPQRGKNFLRLLIFEMLPICLLTLILMVSQ